MKRVVVLSVFPLIACLCLAVTARAAVNTWTGTGNWNTPGNWSRNLVPPDGEDVVIESGVVTLTNGTAQLSSYRLKHGATNVFEIWAQGLRATTVTVEGYMTHPTNTDTSASGGWVPDRRVYIECTDFRLATNGVICVDSNGWTSPKNSGGYGPGGAPAVRDGGGYGGKGGDFGLIDAGGPTYGSASMPTNPGSGGSGDVSYGLGGFGGGAVRIAAQGHALIEGAITARGGPGLGANNRGGGSGGGIYITCDTFAATNGVLQADGGDVLAGTTGCGGGGGRIAIVFTNTTAQNLLPLPDLQLSAIGGNKSNYSRDTGRHGSLYFGSYRLTVAAGPGGAADVSSGWYTNGAQVTIGASHDGSHTFLQWSGNGVPDGAWTNNPLTVSMDRARSVQANFQSNTVATYTRVASGDWFDAAGWSPQGIPGTQDDVVIHAGAVLLQEPVAVDAVSVSNATLFFTNWATTLTATDVDVLNGGVVTIASAFFDRPMHLYTSNSLPATNRIAIVCTNLTVAEGGVIDADELGFAGCFSVANHVAHGPGRAVSGIQPIRRGVSHGGRGSDQVSVIDGYYAGPTYGSVSAPVLPGTGGQTVSGPGTSRPGGGAVRIDARSVVVNGEITADGGGGATYQGGSSGGSVYITCRTIGGAGVISADGANNGTVAAPGGGGGRIAVVYDAGAQGLLGAPQIRFSARGGTGLDNNADNYLAWADADMGTVYFPDSQFITAAFVPDITGELHFGDSDTDWTGPSLALSNCWMRLPTGFVFNVTGPVTVTGSTSVARLELPHGELNCGGNLVFADGAALHVYAGPTNGIAAAYGALVAVSGNIVLGAGSLLSPHSHPADGGSVKFAADDVEVPATAAIDADRTGYGPNSGPGGSNNSYDGGGGYGGAGGRANAAHPLGGTYGLEQQPVAPGSGGGGYCGRNGGGLVWLELSGTLNLDGSISADGGTGSINGGLGSGGGVYVNCFGISGTGTITAAGGDNTRAGDCAGGGGRIAVLYWTDAFNHANASAAGGTAASGGTYDGADGTVYWESLAPEGCLFLIK